ncbi:hypothetical protein DENSPDRAFT_671661 [Dentipellis sp. KUC8613]|nr:hypothetical protein DENSPDRAFT_671661 [Dentipellis sp. KUC8613]
MYTAVDLGAGVGRIELVDVEASMGASAGVVHIVGPVLLGCLLGWCLYGMLFGQLFIYYMSFPQDRLLVKFSVYILFALETLQTTAITQLAWALLCAGWGDPRALRFSAWGYAALPLVSALVAAWVQLFFAWRVGVLAFGSGSGGEGAGTGTGTGEGSGGGAGWRWIWRVVVALVVLSALVQCVAGIVASIKFMALSDVAKSYADIMRPNAAVRTWLASSAACDVLVAASMVILVRPLPSSLASRACLR